MTSLDLSHKVLVTSSYLQDIGNAIREKNGLSLMYTPAQMASAIAEISGGGGGGEYTLLTEGTSYVDLVDTEAKSIRSYCFCSAYKLKTVQFDQVRSIGQSAFYRCSSLTNASFPVCSYVTSYAFAYCSALSKVYLGDARILSSSAFYYCSNLQAVGLGGSTVCILASSSVFYSTPISGTSATGYIYVPNSLIATYKGNASWASYSSRITGISLENLEIKQKNFNIYNKTERIFPITCLYNGSTEPFHDEDKEVAITTSTSGAEVVNNNSIKLSNDVAVGASVNVTATSVKKPSITTTKAISVISREATISVDLNSGQWADSGTTVDGHIVYKSDVGSYNIVNGSSKAIITVDGYTDVTIYIRSYAESSYDYTEAFAADETAVRGKGLFTTKSKQSATTYVECTYQLDGDTHTIEILYSKDSSGDTSDDRGYFYIGECS